MFTDGKKIIIFFVAIFIFLGCSSNPQKNLNANTNEGQIMVSEKELIFWASQKAKEVGINVDNCNIKIFKENNFTVVNFCEKMPKDHFQTGGEVSIFFKKKNNEYEFIKGEVYP